MKESPKEIIELERTLEYAGPFKPIKSPFNRGYFWKDKAGSKISYREFIDRWKRGMEGITPLQQFKGQLNSTYIILVGILLGFVVTLFNFESVWWLSIILGAAFFNTLIQGLGIWQKVRILKRLENEL